MYFWNKTLHVSNSISVHRQESITVHISIGICHTGFADCLLVSSQQNLYVAHLLLCVQYQTPDDGQRNCPKHLEFYSKNKFEKLVYLVGFIIRIYNGARSFEYQTPYLICIKYMAKFNSSELSKVYKNYIVSS